jgi:hypothetical protein
MQQYNQGQGFSQPQQNFSNNYPVNQLFNQQNSQFQNNQNYNYSNQSDLNINPTVGIPSKQSIKQAKPNKSIFSIKNLLIGILSIYSIFSFVWIAILYLGVDGNKICLEDNVVCKVSVPLTKQAAITANNNIETKNQLVKQKSAKNYIKDIWQNQAILNDTLVTRQQSVEKSINGFSGYIQNYIRFINDKPEFLKGFSKTELDNKKSDIEQQLANLKLLQDNNYQNKINNQKQINELYQELGERQDNSFVSER